jgi:hypothetical protein
MALLSHAQLDANDVLKEFHYTESEWIPIYVCHNIHFEIDETVRPTVWPESVVFAL